MPSQHQHGSRLSCPLCVSPLPRPSQPGETHTKIIQMTGCFECSSTPKKGPFPFPKWSSPVLPLPPQATKLKYDTITIVRVAMLSCKRAPGNYCRWWCFDRKWRLFIQVLFDHSVTPRNAQGAFQVTAREPFTIWVVIPVLQPLPCTAFSMLCHHYAPIVPLFLGQNPSEWGWKYMWKI